MGGSSLGAKAIYNFLENPKKKLIFLIICQTIHLEMIKKKI